MSGFPRDLAVLDPWDASFERSRARRARARRGRIRNANSALAALIDTRSRAVEERDLAEELPWELSLGRSRARRRAAEMRFVPGSTRAKRVSLGALAALAVAPAAGLADGGATTATGARNPEPATTTEHAIVLSEGSEGRQVELLQKAVGGVKVDGIFGPETEAAVRAFQTSRALTVDGVVGPATATALRGEAAARALTTGVNASLPGEASSSAAGAHEAIFTGTTTEPESSTETTKSGGTATTAGEPAASSTASTADASATPAGAAKKSASAGTPEKTEEDAVARLQSALHLTTDSDFGPETEAAIRRLQARHGLTVDGVVGPATWEVLGVHGAETLTPPAGALPKPHRHRSTLRPLLPLDPLQTLHQNRLHRHLRLLCQQTNPRLKRLQPSITRPPAFRENQHVIPLVHSLSSMSEALPQPDASR